MTNYKAGSVTAEITLDTTKFNEAIGKLKEEVASLKTEFENVKGSSSFAETIQALKKEVDSLKEKNKELLDSNKKMSKSFKDMGKDVKSEINYLKNLSPEFKKNIQNVNEMVKSNSKLSKSQEQVTKSFKKQEQELTKLSKIERAFIKDYLTLTNKYKGQNASAVPLKPVFEDLKKKYLPYLKDIQKFEKLFDNIVYTGSSLYPSRDADKNVRFKSRTMSSAFGYIDASSIKTLEQVKSELKGVTSENNKVTKSNEKTSQSVVKSSEQVIKSKAKEAEAVKLYTLEEIRLLEELNSEYVRQKKNGYYGIGNNLYPIDHKYATNYSTLKNKYRRRELMNSNTGLQLDYNTHGYSDFTKVFQARMKELLGDLGVVISSKSDREFKRVRDAFNGKMVEYLDLSGFKDNKQWIEKVKNQIYDADFFKGKIPLPIKDSSLKKHILGYDLDQLKFYMDWQSKNAFEEYGKEGNPYVKQMIKDMDLTKYYKQAQRRLDNVFYHPNKIKEAGKALALFDRQLKSTEINLRKLGSMGKPFDPTIKQLQTASNAFRLFELQTNPQKFLKNWSNATITFKRSATEIENAIRKFASLDYTGKNGTRYDNYGRNLLKVAENAKKANVALKEISGTTKQEISHFEQLARTARGASLGLMNLQRGYSVGSVAQEQFNQSLNKSIYNAEQYKQRLEKIAIELTAKWHSMTAELAKANAGQYKYWQQSRGSVSGYAEPLPIKGYNDYLKAIKEVNQGLAEFKRRQQSINNVAKYTDDNLKVAGQALSRMNRELEREVRTVKLANRQLQLWHKYHRIDRGTYISNMGNINAKLKEQTSNLKQNNGELTKNNANVRKAGRGLTSFNNGVVQTAHSGRILSNTLYQIRGALLSLKMIFTAMGGMMLWGFAMDMAESVKTTVTAKNEMEAQLKQRFTNKKTGEIDTASIQYFRKELDKLPNTFKKVNKYSIGETVSSIGLEFDLTAKQMKDALPIVTMVQSEYVRAGRKEDEAALAVKDILQGEFQRLSRETGIGKEELIAYGWDEDKENIDGLLQAVKKAGLARHWDTFAKKATSLNDVLTITKSRFSELGAELMDSVTPMIVSAFNWITDSLSGLQTAFGNLGAFWQNFAIFGGGTALFGGILTVLPMITKGMGLADIATLGWTKSIGTAVLNLNKAEVAQYGFRKALSAVIAGTKASELANVRWTKAIAGRLLGINQATLAEHGYLTALVRNKLELTKGITVINDSGIATMSLRQKIIYLAKGEYVADKASATWGKTIKSLLTSLKLWRIAIAGIIGVGLIAWLSSVAMWTDTVKGRVEKYNHVLAEGKDEIKSMQKNIDTYDKRLSEMSKSDKDYNIISQNKATLEHNLESMKMAYKYAKDIKKETKEQSQIHKGMISRGVEGAYETAGVDNLLERNNIYQEMKYVAYDLKKAEEESYKFNYQSLQHINEKVGLMKQDADIQAKGIKDEKERAQFEKDAQDARVKYITEYSLKAEEASKHLKEFNEGNLEAGVYYLLDRLSLAWIDLWNDNDFVTFWRSVKQTWDDLKPTLEWLKDTLLSLGRVMAQFFSTDTGRWVGAFALLGGAVLGLGWKFRGVLGTLKDLGTTIWDRIKDFRGLKKSAEEASEKMEKTGTTGTTSPTSKAPTSWKETKGLIKQDFLSNARSFVNNATKIAMAMGYLTVAIATLSAPMLALAVEGELFKRIKPQVLSGVEGLKTIAPVVVAFMIPATALMVIFDKYKVSTAQMTDAFKNSAVGIALAITLVAEAIFLLNVPLLSLAILGQVYGKIESSVQEGVKAIRATTDALGALMPWIPVFIAGIALAGITLGTEGVGGIAILAVAGGIAVAIGLVTEAIMLLFLPLEAIKELGEKYSPDLPAIRKGAEALKITAEALGYVEQGMSAFAGIAWASLSEAIAKLVGIELGVDLTQLTGDDGFFKQLETFTDEFNKISITPIDTDKVATLKESATGIDTVKTALNTVKDALKDLPNFNVDNRSTNEKYQDAVGGKETTEGITNYFEQLKEPITQLNEFIGNFNSLEIEPVEPDQVTTLQNSANAITTIQTAIEAVKNAVGAGVDAQWNSNVQTSGILGAGINLLVGNAGQSSSIKGSLDELYNCVKDIMDFNTRISGLTSEGSGDTSGIQNSSNMVSALQTQINSLKTTLSGAIPTIQSTAKGMGTAIVTGFQSGLTGVDSTAKTAGESIGTNLKSGFETNFKIKDVTTTEIDNTLTYLDGKKQSFYDKGKALGDSLSQGYKDGQDIHSPGIIARSTSEELGRVEEYLSNAQINLPQLAYNLGNSISSNFNFDLGLGNLQLPDLSIFQQGLSTIAPMVTTVKDNVSLQFDTMKTNIGGAFSGILSNTKLNMSGMLSATTKNIGAIRTSWKGMQSALIASAENIKTQTGQKISKLKTNLGDFWNKIKHPDQLIGSAGSPNKGTRPIRYGGSQRLGGYAGTPMFKPKISSSAPDDDLKKYLACMMATGSPCYAGWNFNWTSKISDKFNGWNTHFNKFNLDSHLNVGKFKNSNFPVKGMAGVAKDYISEVIRNTTYDFYFNEKYGSPAEALRAGSFNCFDGTRVVLALAEAFGFGGGDFGHGTWNGIGHVWASIPGLGIIDPTALQKGQGFRSSSVKGYGAGTTTRNSSTSNMNMGNTYGDVNITINNNGKDMTIDEKKIDRETSKKIWSIINPSLNTGL